MMSMLVLLVTESEALVGKGSRVSWAMDHGRRWSLDKDGTCTTDFESRTACGL